MPQEEVKEIHINPSPTVLYRAPGCALVFCALQFEADLPSGRKQSRTWLLWVAISVNVSRHKYLKFFLQSSWEA